MAKLLDCDALIISETDLRIHRRAPPLEWSMVALEEPPAEDWIEESQTNLAPSGSLLTCLALIHTHLGAVRPSHRLLSEAYPESGAY